jgi:hypothetical protein
MCCRDDNDRPLHEKVIAALPLDLSHPAQHDALHKQLSTENSVGNFMWAASRASADRRVALELRAWTFLLFANHHVRRFNDRPHIVTRLQIEVFDGRVRN